jgi:hypothetical protein
VAVWRMLTPRWVATHVPLTPLKFRCSTNYSDRPTSAVVEEREVLHFCAP